MSVEFSMLTSLTVTHATSFPTQGNWIFISQDTTQTLFHKLLPSVLNLNWICIIQSKPTFYIILFNLQMDPVMSIRWSVCFAGDLNPKANTEFWVRKLAWCCHKTAPQGNYRKYIPVWLLANINLSKSNPNNVWATSLEVIMCALHILENVLSFSRFREHTCHMLKNLRHAAIFVEHLHNANEYVVVLKGVMPRKKTCFPESMWILSNYIASKLRIGSGLRLFMFFMRSFTRNKLLNSNGSGSCVRNTSHNIYIYLYIISIPVAANYGATDHRRM